MLGRSMQIAIGSFQLLVIAGCRPPRTSDYEAQDEMELPEVPAVALPANQSVIQECRAIVRENNIPRCVAPRDSIPGAEARYRLFHENALVTRMEYENAQGAPVIGFAGCAHWSFAYVGVELVSEACNGPLGEPVSSYRYQPGGRRALVGRDGQPAWDRNYNLLESTLDGHGRALSYRFLDETGAARRNEQRVHAIWVSRDATGSVVDQAYYDEHDQKMLDASGVHRLVRQVDEHGLPTLVQYFDIENQPVVASTGEHAIRYVRDAAGNVIKKLHFDVSGNLTRTGPGGVAGLLQEWDAQGHLVRTAVLDEKEAIIDGPEGYASQRLRYDEKGNLTERWYFDAREQPVALPSGQTFERMRYDAHGALVERWYFDAAAQPITTKNGYAAVTYQYNNVGLVGRVKYYDASGAPALSDDGHAGYVQNYDREFRVVERTTFDMSQRASAAKLGYATTRYRYIGTGRPAARTYFDEQNAEVHPESVALIQVEFAAKPPAPLKKRKPGDPPAPPAPRTKAEAKKRIQAALTRLGAGVTFPELAREFSDTQPAVDGSKPVVRTTLPPEVQAALASLEPGRPSAVIETKNAYLVVQLMKQTP